MAFERETLPSVRPEPPPWSPVVRKTLSRTTSWTADGQFSPANPHKRSQLQSIYLMPEISEREAIKRKVLDPMTLEKPRRLTGEADDGLAEWMRRERLRAEERAERKWRQKFQEWQRNTEASKVAEAAAAAAGYPSAGEAPKAPAANDMGAPIAVGTDGSGRYYCGLVLGKEAIPGSDGQCGPSEGPQCASCKRYQKAADKNEPKSALVIARKQQAKQRDLEAKVEALRVKLDGTRRENEALRSDREHMQAQLSADASELAVAKDDVARLQQALQQERGYIQGLERQLAQAGGESEAWQDRAGQREELLHRAVEERAEALQRIEELGAIVAELQARAAQAEEAVAELRGTAEKAAPEDPAPAAPAASRAAPVLARSQTEATGYTDDYDDEDDADEEDEDDEYDDDEDKEEKDEEEKEQQEQEDEEDEYKDDEEEEEQEGEEEDDAYSEEREEGTATKGSSKEEGSAQSGSKQASQEDEDEYEDDNEDDEEEDEEQAKEEGSASGDEAEEEPRQVAAEARQAAEKEDDEEKDEDEYEDDAEGEFEDDDDDGEQEQDEFEKDDEEDEEDGYWEENGTTPRAEEAASAVQVAATEGAAPDSLGAREAAAATRIQSMQRGKVARRQVEQRRELRQQQADAPAVQVISSADQSEEVGLSRSDRPASEAQARTRSEEESAKEAIVALRHERPASAGMTADPSRLQNGELDGYWTTVGTREGLTITGHELRWESGIAGRGRIAHSGRDEFFAEIDDQTFYAKLVGNKLLWSDGDEWERRQTSKDADRQSASPAPPASGRASTDRASSHAGPGSEELLRLKQTVEEALAGGEAQTPLVSEPETAHTGLEAGHFRGSPHGGSSAPRLASRAESDIPPALEEVDVSPQEEPEDASPSRPARPRTQDASENSMPLSQYPDGSLRSVSRPESGEGQAAADSMEELSTSLFAELASDGVKAGDPSGAPR